MRHNLNPFHTPPTQLFFCALGCGPTRSRLLLSFLCAERLRVSGSVVSASSHAHISLQPPSQSSFFCFELRMFHVRPTTSPLDFTSFLFFFLRPRYWCLARHRTANNTCPLQPAICCLCLCCTCCCSRLSFRLEPCVRHPSSVGLVCCRPSSAPCCLERNTLFYAAHACSASIPPGSTLQLLGPDDLRLFRARSLRKPRKTESLFQNRKTEPSNRRTSLTRPCPHSPRFPSIVDLSPAPMVHSASSAALSRPSTPVALKAAISSLTVTLPPLAEEEEPVVNWAALRAPAPSPTVPECGGDALPPSRPCSPVLSAALAPPPLIPTLAREATPPSRPSSPVVAPAPLAAPIPTRFSPLPPPPQATQRPAFAFGGGVPAFGGIPQATQQPTFFGAARSQSAPATPQQPPQMQPTQTSFGFQTFAPLPPAVRASVSLPSTPNVRAQFPAPAARALFASSAHSSPASAVPALVPKAFVPMAAATPLFTAAPHHPSSGALVPACNGQCGAGAGAAVPRVPGLGMVALSRTGSISCVRCGQRAFQKLATAETDPYALLSVCRAAAAAAVPTATAATPLHPISLSFAPSSAAPSALGRQSSIRSAFKPSTASYGAMRRARKSAHASAASANDKENRRRRLHAPASAADQPSDAACAGVGEGVTHTSLKSRRGLRSRVRHASAALATAS
jgi:hypothetical protein